MLFNTPEFVVAFLLVLALFWICPKTIRKYYLLIVNMLYAYFLGGVAMVIGVTVATLIAFLFGFIIKKKENKRANLITGIVIICLIVYGNPSLGQRGYGLNIELCV